MIGKFLHRKSVDHMRGHFSSQSSANKSKNVLDFEAGANPKLGTLGIWCSRILMLDQAEASPNF